ncbi:MAG: DUF3078 domain-containing protein [Chitinophagaceae bacterium]|nr:DUF3078 domain-containing protein [Chitinophagaceae bacterium]
MKKSLLTFILLLFVVITYAQDKQVDNMKKERNREIKKDEKQPEGWTKGGVFNLNLSQGASRNWAAGAEKASFSLNALINSFAYYKRERHAWDNTINLQYGLVNATSIGTRKNDDRIDLLSRYGYQLKNPKWYISALGNIRTQFTDGFDYSVIPKKQNSAFFAPAYLLVSPGMMYKPNATFDVFLSPVTSRWVLVNNKHQFLRTSYGFTDTTKSTRNEIGAFLTANLKRDIAKNISYTTRLDLFSNYRNNPKNVDVFWTNVIGMKVNKYIGVTYNFDLIYDDDVQDAKRPGRKLGTQLKSLLGVGLTATF